VRVDQPHPAPFELTVVDVFTLTGRGLVVCGPIEHGSVRTGERVGVWRDEHLVATAIAQIEMICKRDADPRSSAIVLRGGIDRDQVRPGDLVRRLVDHPDGLTALLPLLETPLDRAGLQDHEAQQLVLYALTSWSDWWVGKALDWIEHGVRNDAVAAAARQVSEDPRFAQEMRHRARKNSMAVPLRHPPPFPRSS
jgi:hypothetical protein